MNRIKIIVQVLGNIQPRFSHGRRFYNSGLKLVSRNPQALVSKA